MLKIDKLFIQNQDQSKSQAICFISSPSESQEKLLGKLLITAKIEGTGKKDFQIMNFTAESVKNYYYNFYLSKDNKIFPDFESVFEDALQKTNLKLNQELEKENNIELLKKLNIIVAVVKNNEIRFSQFGKCQAFLVRKNKIINIMPASQKDNEKDILLNTPIKIFSHITNGCVEDNDKLLLCADSISNYFSEEKLKNIITTYSTREIYPHLKNLLNKVYSQGALSAVIIETDLDHKRNLAKNERDAIIKSLFGREPACAGRPVKKSKHGQKFTKKPPGVFYNFKNRLIKIVNKIASFIKNLFLQMKPANLKKKLKKIIQKVDDIISSCIRRFNKLPYKSKILLIVSLVLAILFVQSTFLLILKQKRKREIQVYNQLIEKIENLQTAGLATLIYKDEMKAEELLEEAETLLKELPQNLAEQQKKIESLKQENKALLNKIHKIISIDDPLILIDFNKINPDVQTKGILNFNQALYAYDNDSIYKINLENKEITDTFNFPSNDRDLKYASVLDANSLLFYQKQGKLVKFNNKNKAFASLEIHPKETSENIKDITIYGQRLYLLNSQDNQILKYLKTSTGFGNQSLWIKDPQVDIKNSVSFAIDSAIYVLKSDGQIVKLYLGMQQNFVVDNFEPALINPTKIFTDLKFSHIYILDPPSKRIIILNKEGRLQKQYYSEKFDDLKNFVVDEKEEKIYLLNGQKIFIVSIE